MDLYNKLSPKSKSLKNCWRLGDPEAKMILYLLDIVFDIKCYLRLTLFALIANPRYPLRGQIRSVGIIVVNYQIPELLH